MTKRLSAAEAVEELFQLYADDVYRYAVSVLGKPAEAEDVVQEVFIRVLKSWDGFRNESSVKTWVWTIVRNCIQDVYRKRYRRNELLTDEGTLPERMAYQEDENVLELEDTLKGLSESYRQVVTLRLIQDMSTEDTAKILGWTTAKVRTTLHRAVSVLRGILHPDVARPVRALPGARALPGTPALPGAPALTGAPTPAPVSASAPRSGKEREPYGV